MNHRSEHEDVVERMRAANPVSAATLKAALGEDELDAAQRRAIEAGEARDAVEPGAHSERPPRMRPGLIRRRGATLGLSAGLACVAVGAAIVVFAGGSVGGGDQPAFAAAAIEVAEANPRLLVTEPGWAVIRADDFEADSGEMTFSDGTYELQVTWYPARYYEHYLRDRDEVSPAETSSLLGQTATTVHYGGNEYATMLEPQGAVFVEVRGQIGSKQGYQDVLASLQPVDVETWLSAMPASVVQPTDRDAVVQAMLEGVPLPPDFDARELSTESGVLDRYHLGAAVTGAVACNWLDRWAAATDAGDRAAADAAVQAMSTSPDWPILREMADQGGWSQVVWQYSRQIANGELDRRIAAEETLENGTTYELGPGYAIGLGCDSAFRRRVDD